MNKKIWIAVFLLGLATAVAQATVTVTNLVVAQRPGTKTMEVTYDVQSSDNTSVSVFLVVSNGAERVEAPSVTGDVGDGVQTGTGKVMIWDAGADWNGNVAELSYCVVADDGMNLVVPAGMVLVPGGINEGVCPDSGSNYTLSVSSFCMDETEITKDFWEYVYGWAINNGYSFSHAGEGFRLHKMVQCP